MRPTVRPAAWSISSTGASPPPAGRSPTCTLATTSGSSTSQVKPVDAFGAILRGRQVVVVGDSRQLPPTDFFAVISEGEEEESGDSVGDMESILSLLLGRGAPERMLRWHYRSRHESLIAVSNHEFYGDRLVIFPSPGTHAEARGLRLRHLPATAYEPGGGEGGGRGRHAPCPGDTGPLARGRGLPCRAARRDRGSARPWRGGVARDTGYAAAELTYLCAAPRCPGQAQRLARENSTASKGGWRTGSPSCSVASNSQWRSG